MEELIKTITAKVGITPEQAKAGLGLVLKLAKDKLGPEFSKLSGALPAAEALIAGAPQAGGLGGLAGGLLGGLGGGKLAGLAGLAGALGAAQKVGLNKDQLLGIGAQATDFLKAKGGPGVAELLKKALG